MTNDERPTTNEIEELQENIDRVRARIAAAAERVGRDPAAVTLVAVTKTVPASRVRMAWESGVTDFGENRVQEALKKIPLIFPEEEASESGWPASTSLFRIADSGVQGRKSEIRNPESGIHWHMIGHVQRNKVKHAIPLFDLVHSVDSVRLAREIDRRASQFGKRMPVLIEVNVASEASKYGFPPEAVTDAIPQIVDLPHVIVQGLMTIAPIAGNPEEVRPHFRRLRRLRDQLADQFPGIDWHHLSMGMTDDFEVAVEEGATLVRIGRAIFGER